MIKKIKRTLESLIKLYDNTIDSMKSMKEHNANPEAISFVLEMRQQAEEQLKNLVDKDSVLLNQRYFSEYSPYYRHRFVLDFGVDGVKDYSIVSVSYSDTLIVTFRNSEDFFVPEYFEKNTHFDHANLYILSPFGEDKAVIEFKDLDVKSFTMDEFNYKTDRSLKTCVEFTFKSISHKTL